MAKEILDVPGLEPKPIVGWLGNVAGMFSDPLSALTDLHKQYGDVLTISRGGNPHLFFSGPGKHHTLFVFGSKYNHQLMTNPDVFHSGPILSTLFPYGEVDTRRQVLQKLSVGLFGLNGETHRRQRRLIMPAFHKQRLNIYSDDIVRITNQKINQWKIDAPIDIWREMMDLTLQVVAQCLFGVNALKESQAFGELIQTWIKLAVSPGVLLFQSDIPGLPYHRFVNISHQLDSIVRDLIQKIRPTSETNADVLSLMISAKDEDGNPAFTDDEIVGHSAIFFTAGHETSSNALAWTFFLLSQHPHVMERLHLEIDSVLGSASPSIEHIKQMPYLDAIVKESLRLMPPAPLSARIVVEPVEVGGYQLPIGTEVVFSAFHTHRDETIYENPHQFIPERWETINPTAYEYIPFSTGIRSCVGMPLALMEIPIILAMVFQKFNLELSSSANVIPHIGLTMSPKHGMPMIVQPRDGDANAGVGNVKGTIHKYIDLKSI